MMRRRGHGACACFSVKQIPQVVVLRTEENRNRSIGLCYHISEAMASDDNLGQLGKAAIQPYHDRSVISLSE